MKYISRQNNILVIRGVTTADLQCSTKSYDTHTEPINIYCSIPSRFIDKESWPTSTNLKCWYCDNIPESYPKFIPINPEKTIDGIDTCSVLGNFCEWNCAVSYIRTEISKEYQYDLLQSLNTFEQKFSDRKRIKIPQAPSKTQMMAYCGPGGLTKSEWYDKLKKINSDYSLYSKY